MKTKLEQFGQKFIYIILAIWLSTEVLFNSNIQHFFIWEKSVANDFMNILVLVLLILQVVVFQKYTFKEMVLIFAISLPIILATLNSNSKTMMSTWIFIIAVKYIDLDKTIKISYIVQGLMTLLVIYMYYAVIIEETVTYRGSLLRHSLGFIHPNQLGVRVFLLIICHCYLRRNRIGILEYIIVSLGAWVVKRVADSKTAFYALVILLVLLLVYGIAKRFDNGKEIFSNSMIMIFFAANIISISLSVFNIMSNDLLKKIDIYMSRRFSQCHRTYQYYGLSIFGKDIQLLVKRNIVSPIYHFWLDNAYMAILLRYGIVVFFIFMGLYLSTMIYLRETGECKLLMIPALYSIYGIMENNFFSMSQNFFLILLSYSIYRSNVGLALRSRKKIKFTW
ncbi:MAG: hypothetical protein IJI01_02125 [Butyrivibrio sp.]|uniref:hypothetical protein n=1 Tax=Butyrivibrio sp. TaxID=28121 RepID=UPI0025BD2F2F|nr:hypothetical protein [Butyrivibrio sp.]MBQ6587458.1 hypothetical protein [Butyrivibrio sp.]